MNKSSLETNPNNRRVFIACLLSFSILITPIAAMAGTQRSEVSRQKSERGSSPTVREGVDSADNLFVHPAIPEPAPAPPILGVTATMAAAITTDVDSDTKADPGVDTITYTATITNNSVGDVSGVQFTDTVDTHTTLVAGSSVATGDDRYNAIGNVTMSIPDGSTDLLNNDFDPETGNNTGMTATAETKSSTNCTGGCSNNVTIAADGSFTYDPPAGFSGTDTFTYTAHSGTNTAPGTARITVSGAVWFIKTGASSCTSLASNCGTLAHPFSDLASFQAVNDGLSGPPPHPKANDTIFIYTGNANYTGPVTLLSGQFLIGQGASASISSIAGLPTPSGTDQLPATGGTNPTITSASNGINLGSGNTIRGLTVGATTGTKISGTSFGTLTVGNNMTPDVTLSGNGQALNLTTGTFAATSAFTSVATTSSTTSGLTLTSVGGTVAFGSTTVSGNNNECIVTSTSTANINYGDTSCTGGGTNTVALSGNTSGTRTFGTLTVSGGTGNAFSHSGGGGNVTVNGAANLSSAAPDTIVIQNAASGNLINFAGGATVNKSAAGGEAIQWSGTNTGATLTFATLALTTTNSIGMNLSGGGTVNVTTAAGSSIGATGNAANNGAAIIANNIALNANFTSVSSTNGGFAGSNGISLTNVTGTSILGTGTLSGAAGATFLVSGGTTSVTYSGGMTQANNAAMVSISGTHNTGTITFQTGTLSATNGTGLQFDDADGTYNFNGTTTLSGAANTAPTGIDIVNGSSGTFSFGANTTITNPLSSTGPNGADAFFFKDSNANVTYSGSITKDTAVTANNQHAIVEIVNQSGGTITFQTGTLSSTSTNASASGIILNNADGTVNFSGTTTLNGGNAHIDINNGSSGTFSFSSNTSVTNPATSTAFVANGSSANVTYSGNLTRSGSSSGLLVDINTEASGTITFQTGTLLASSTSGASTGIQLSNADGTVNFNGTNTLNGVGGDAGIDIINGSSGTFSFSSNSTITSPTGIGFNVNGSAPVVKYDGTITQANGNPAVTITGVTGGNTGGIASPYSIVFTNTITKNTTAANGISISSNTGGSFGFTGAVTTNTSTSNAINLATNTGATITFAGGLNIDTTSGVGFNATGGGTVIAAQNNTSIVNTIDSTTGTALNVTSTTIGASGLTFRSISSNGSVNGIVLNGTGSNAGLTVTGNSSGICGGSITVQPLGTLSTANAPVTADCTGGTIQSTTGHGILLTNTKNTSLTRMLVQNAANGFDEINAQTVNGLTIDHSFITDNAGVGGDRGLEIGDFTSGTAVNGTVTVSNSTIGPTAHDNVGIGIASGTSTWNFTNDVLTGSTLDSGMNFEVRNATVTAFTMDGCIVKNQFADGMQINPASGVNATISNATIQNSSFTTNNIHLDLNHDGTGTSTYKVLNNTFISAVANTINFFSSSVQAPGTGGVLNGRFVNNRIGNNGIANSGGGVGIRINMNGGAAGRVLVDQNVIRQVKDGRGIEIISRNGTGGLDATVTNNDVSAPINTLGAFAQLAAIFLQSNCVTVCNTLRSDIRSNTVPSSPATDGEFANGMLQIVRSGASTNQLVDNAPASPDAASELASHNTGSTAVTGTVTLIAGPINTPPLFFARGGIESAIHSSSLLANLLWPSLGVNNFSTPNASGAVSEEGDSLTQSQLDSLVASGVQHWAATGLTAQQMETLRAVSFEVTELHGKYLGESGDTRVLIDRRAAGRGWFVDTTPQDDSEFRAQTSATRRYTDPLNPAAGHIDLLTAIEHEMGHKLGLDDLYAPQDRDSIMYGYLTVGERRIPAYGEARNARPEAITGVHHLTLADDKKSEVSKQKAESSRHTADGSRPQVTGQTSDVRFDHARNSKLATRNSTVGTRATTMAPVGSCSPSGINGGGTAICVDIPVIHAGDSVTITFQVTVKNPPNLTGVPPGTPQVSNSGAVTVTSPAASTTTNTVNTPVDLFNSQTTVASDHPGGADQGDTINFTATVVINPSQTPTPPSPLTPTGTVTFKSDGTNITGCVNVALSGSGGTATAQCSTSALLAAGSPHSITAFYSGDGNYDPSDNTGAPLSQVINTCNASPVVNQIGDAGDGTCDATCTLRDAVTTACNGATITFDTAGVFATPQTITLGGTELSVARNVTINAPAAAGNHVTVSGNNASRVFNINSGKTVNISNLTISNGHAITGALFANEGGGIYNDHGTLKLTNCVLSGNTADDSGGGIFNNGFTSGTASTTIIGCTFSGNTAVNGGGLYNYGDTGTATTSIINSTFTGNTATGVGGAIDNYGAGATGNGTVDIVNSTISGNNSNTNGGGVYNTNNASAANAATTLTNVTVTNNRADNDNNGTGTGGGIFVSDGNVTLINTIVAGNLNEDGATDSADDIGGTVNATSSYNLIGDAATAGGLVDKSTDAAHGNIVGNSGTGTLSINSILDTTLANNGGSTLTHRLVPGSPAIEAGVNGSLPPDTYDLDGDANTGEPLPVDQRGVGFPRVADSADLDTTAVVDIGAFELHPTIQDIADTSTNEDTQKMVTFNIGDDVSSGGTLITSVAATSSNTTLVTSDNAHLAISGSGGSRTLTITPNTNANSANSGGDTTITVTVTATNGRTASDQFVLSVNAQNDAPSITAGGTLNYTENQAATAIDTTITVNDIDSANLASATVQITGNYVNGEDVLSFIDTANITGNFAPATGTLTLMGSDTLANYQTALRSVMYNNTSDNPSTSARTVSWTVNDGSLPSNTATSTINVTPVNDAPSVTSLGMTVTNGGTGTVDNTKLFVTDPDNTAAQETYTVQAAPTHGTLKKGVTTLTAASTFTQADINSNLITYTHDGTATTSDVFTFTISDGAGGTVALTSFNITIGNPPLSIQDAKAAEPTAGTTNMLFTVSLPSPAGASGASVNYATADQSPLTGHAVGGASCNGTTVDYMTATGTVSFATGEQVKTISVTVCSDNNNAEPDETFLVNLSSPTNATIGDGQAVGTITAANTAGTFIISELRTSGPGGLGDDFVELYNNTDTLLTVTASDASAGYGLFKVGADCNATPVLIATIPNGTVIPARGHYLLVGSQYSLSNYGGVGAAAGDQTLTSDIESDHSVALFKTANVANLSSATQLDAVGMDGFVNAGGTANGVCDLFREGTTLPAASGSTLEYSFFRKLTSGTPQDTNVNSADFMFVDTQGTSTPMGQQLGAPGPENKTSPINRDTTVAIFSLDSSISPSGAPNRDRVSTPNTPNATVGAFGTLSFRRRIQNNTGGPVTRLRFRIVNVTTLPPGAGDADLRAITSSNVSVSNVHDTTTCVDRTAGTASNCTVLVRGTLLEQPPNQTKGGAYNSTMSVDLSGLPGGSLANGQSIELQFQTGVMQTGHFRFIVIVEALP